VQNDTVRLPSYAKINLGLIVKGRRSDGFHDIETILQQISLKDDIQLTLRPQQDITLRTNDKTLPTDETNLCVQAARSLQQESGFTAGVEIELHKRIPVGAGLGGGSSNAAVVLLGLNKLLNLGFSQAELEALAAKIGSDVPFFIRGGCALATGRGEKLESIDLHLQQKRIVVIFPEIHISTKWAYENLNLSLTKSKKNLIISSFKDRIINDVDFFAGLQNDFEGPVFARYPVLAQAKYLLYERGAEHVSLSGSGSAMFAIFSEGIEGSVPALFPKYRTFFTEFVHWGFGELIN